MIEIDGVKYDTIGTNDIDNCCSQCALWDKCKDVENSYCYLHHRVANVSSKYEVFYFINHITTNIEIEKRNIIKTFSEKISKQKDCPQEFIDIVNDNFWELL